MGLDLWVGPADPQPHEKYETKVTWNLLDLLKRSGVHYRLLEGLTVKEVRPVFANAAAVVRDNPEYFQQFVTTPDWGSFEWALEFLEGLATYLEDAPDDYVVSMWY